MKKVLKYGIPFLLFFEANAQIAVYDNAHHKQVLDNYMMRTVTENGHTNNLKSIRNSVQNIEANLQAVILLQTKIYSSLVSVNSALKQGIMVKNLGLYTSQILFYCNEMVTMAKDEPYLLLFAEEYSISSRRRIIEFTHETTDLILKGGKDLMMDFTKRDLLLKRVTEELLILRGASYGALNSMRFAKRNGVLRKLNPMQNYINKDRQLVDDILFNYKYLQK